MEEELKTHDWEQKACNRLAPIEQHEPILFVLEDSRKVEKQQFGKVNGYIFQPRNHLAKQRKLVLEETPAAVFA